MSTFVSSEALGFTNLSTGLPSGLLLTEQSSKADFLICTAEQRFAVCLEPASGFQAFELVGVNDAWRGCFVSGVQVQAGLTSGFTRFGRDIRPGDLVISKAWISVATRPIQMGHLPRLIKWKNAADLGPGALQGGFSRWRVVRIENQSVDVLKEINSDGKS